MSFVIHDYQCAECGEIQRDILEKRGALPDSLPCQSSTCTGRASRLLGAPKVGTNWLGSVSRGKSDERPHAGILDTRAIADGMPVKEWKKKRAEFWRDRDLAENRKKMG